MPRVMSVAKNYYIYFLKKFTWPPRPPLFVTFLLLIIEKKLLNQKDVEFDFNIGHALIFPFLWTIIKTMWGGQWTHFPQVHSLIIPFTNALSHHYADDAWTSNACYGLNFHQRDLKFSDIVPNTITIMNKN